MSETAPSTTTNEHSTDDNIAAIWGNDELSSKEKIQATKDLEDKNQEEITVDDELSGWNRIHAVDTNQDIIAEIDTAELFPPIKIEESTADSESNNSEALERIENKGRAKAAKAERKADKKRLKEEAGAKTQEESAHRRIKFPQIGAALRRIKNLDEVA